MDWSTIEDLHVASSSTGLPRHCCRSLLNSASVGK
jgi:hypothetical protein